MATYTKETALYDTGKIGTDITNAGQTATNYITTVGNDGIKVHPNSDQYNYTKIDATGMEVFRQNADQNPTGSVSVAKFGSTVRIGKDDESHLKMNLNSMELADRVGTSYLEVADNDIVEEVTQTKDNFDANYFGVNYPIYQVLRLAIDGVETSDYSYRKGSTTINVFDTRPSSPVSLSVTYTTVALGKYYNFGYRGNGYPEGKLSVIEGLNTIAQGDYSHAEGRNAYAWGEGAHAEGYNTSASGHNSHAEGGVTHATGHYSHAEGTNTYATGYGSHAQNSYTIASKADQTALGRYNIEDTATMAADQKALIIGNGTSDNARSNALTVDWNGNVWASGLIKDTLNTTAPTVTRTAGATVSSVAYAQSGHVAQLTLGLSYSTSVAAGANVFTGTLPAGYRPRLNTVGSSYYGSNALIGVITTDGAITVRNASSSAVTISTGAGISFTYIIN